MPAWWSRRPWGGIPQDLTAKGVAFHSSPTGKAAQAPCQSWQLQQAGLEMLKKPSHLSTEGKRDNYIVCSLAQKHSKLSTQECIFSFLCVIFREQCYHLLNTLLWCTGCTISALTTLVYLPHKSIPELSQKNSQGQIDTDEFPREEPALLAFGHPGHGAFVIFYSNHFKLKNE